MRKLLAFLSLILLTACDKPNSNAEIKCSFLDGWDEAESRIVEYQPHLNTKEVFMTVKTYDNYAIVTMNGKSERFERKMELFDADPYNGVFLEYRGVFHGEKVDRQGALSVYVNVADETALSYNVVLANEKVSMNKSPKQYDWSAGCVPVNDKDRGVEWAAKIPFKHKYAKPNKIERCILEIGNKVFCADDTCSKLIVKYGTEDVILSQEDALKISDNWDYSNMRLYSNADNELKDYEHDACEVLERLNNFISEYNKELAK